MRVFLAGHPGFDDAAVDEKAENQPGHGPVVNIAGIYTVNLRIQVLAVITDPLVPEFLFPLGL